MSENVTTQFDEFDDDNKKNIQDQIKNTSLEDMEEKDENITDNDGLTDEEKREIEKKKRFKIMMRILKKKKKQIIMQKIKQKKVIKKILLEKLVLVSLMKEILQKLIKVR